MEGLWASYKEGSVTPVTIVTGILTSHFCHSLCSPSSYLRLVEDATDTLIKIISNID